MYLLGKYTVPPFIGVEENTYEKAIAEISDDGIVTVNKSSTAVFNVYSDDSKDVFILKFVISVNSELNGEGLERLIHEQAVYSVCSDMNIVS